MTEAKSTPELKPCPFCGGAPKLFIGAVEFTDAEVHCGNCGSVSGNYPTKAEAIAAWNTRAALKGDAPQPKPEEDCACPETSSRNCPVHGQDRENNPKEPKP